jgi:hypothetical protein
MTLGTSLGTHWELGQYNENSFGNIMGLHCELKMNTLKT